MDEQTRIMEPYLKQIEAGAIPSFEGLLMKYSEILDEDPLPAIEMACIASLLVAIYPAEFEQAIAAKLKEMGFPSPVISPPYSAAGRA